MAYRSRLNPFAALLTLGLVASAFAGSDSQVLLGKGNEHGATSLADAPPPAQRELRGKFLHITGMSILSTHRNRLAVLAANHVSHKISTPTSTTRLPHLRRKPATVVRVTPGYMAPRSRSVTVPTHSSTPPSTGLRPISRTKSTLLSGPAILRVTIVTNPFREPPPKSSAPISILSTA